MTAADTTPEAENLHSPMSAERFDRVFGRPPTQADLTRLRSARTGLELRIPAQVRRAAATLVANL
jgi:hypothetical protein